MYNTRPHIKFPVLYLILITGIIFSGCSHMSELTSEHPPVMDAGVDYSVIYYIHADSDYLYHDSDGNPVRENTGVLATAFEVAETARSGEVFIYHQRSERKILGLFPRRSSRFYHYRNGQLINRINYRHPDTEEDFLATEAELINSYRSRNPGEDHQNYILYFGHEIPTGNGKGYHQSLPDIDVNIASFAGGIQNFLLPDEERFDLAVLSTCNNGTPAMAEYLMPVTNVMLASPQNLHLSHIDTGVLTLLEKDKGISPHQLGRVMAEQNYQRLEETVQTTITIALYDFNDIQVYIDRLSSHTAVDRTPDRVMQFMDNVDCMEVNSLETESYLEGVETWYKPSWFGRQSDQVLHSGWGCKPIVESISRSMQAGH